MRSHVLLLAFLAMMTLIHPSFAGFGFRHKRREDRKARQIKLPSQHDKDIIRLRVMKVVSQEMPDASEEEILQRVDELTEAHLKEAFPELYLPAPKPKKVIRNPSRNMEPNAGKIIGVSKMSKPSEDSGHAESEDIWENGTVVRYMARAMAVMLAIAGFIAFKEQILGRETFDGRRIRAIPDKKNQ